MDLERFLAGDSAYFDELVRRYGSMVQGVVRPFARDPDHAKDLFQQVWKNVFQYRERFSGRGAFKAWVYQVAKGICLVDYRNGQGRSRGLARLRLSLRVEGPRPLGEDPLQLLERQERHARVHEALEAIPRREMEAIVLRKLEGRSVEEVASIMGIEKATVHSLIRHGVERLRTILGEFNALS